MLFAAALLGLALGFVSSIPVAGPIAALVFSRGLAGHARSALALASGAALAEGGYVYLAFWGFSGFLSRYAWIESASLAAAAAISTGLGLHFLHRANIGAARPEPAGRPRGRGSFLLGFTVAALNPGLIAAWTAAVTALYGLGLLRFEPAAALPFSLGACAGIILWFTLLLGLVKRFRTRISDAVLGRARRGVGLILVLLGVGLALRLVW